MKKEKIEKLPKIYLVVIWQGCGVLELPLAGWVEENKDMIPMVYDYEDYDGTGGEYVLRKAYEVTSGGIMCWTMNKNKANTIANSLQYRVI